MSSSKTRLQLTQQSDRDRILQKAQQRLAATQQQSAQTEHEETREETLAIGRPKVRPLQETAQEM